MSCSVELSMKKVYKLVDCFFLAQITQFVVSIVLGLSFDRDKESMVHMWRKNKTIPQNTMFIKRSCSYLLFSKYFGIFNKTIMRLWYSSHMRKRH